MEGTGRNFDDGSGHRGISSLKAGTGPSPKVVGPAFPSAGMDAAAPTTRCTPGRDPGAPAGQPRGSISTATLSFCVPDPAITPSMGETSA